MRTSPYTQETMVIENPSKPLVMLMNKLRDRKMAQLKELKEKKDFYFYDLRDLLGIIIEAGNIVVGPLANHPLAGNPEGYVGN